MADAAALLLDPGGPEVARHLGHHLVHHAGIGGIGVLGRDAGQLARADGDLSHALARGSARAPQGPAGAGGEQAHAELGRYRGTDIHVAPGAETAARLGVGHRELPEEHRRDLPVAAKLLGRGRRVALRQEPRDRRVGGPEFEQLEAALAGEDFLGESLGGQLAQAVLRLVGREGDQGDAIVVAEVEPGGHPGELRGTGGERHGGHCGGRKRANRTIFQAIDRQHLALPPGGSPQKEGKRQAGLGADLHCGGNGGLVALAGADPVHLCQVEHEHLAVSYFTGARGGEDGLDRRLHERRRRRRFPVAPFPATPPSPSCRDRSRRVRFRRRGP